jgi:hypothetical protein
MTGESGFGGLVVSMLASGTQDRGFAPDRSRRIFPAVRYKRHKRQLKVQYQGNEAQDTAQKKKPPGRSRRIFRVKKIHSMPSFGGEVKPSIPCRRFAAC